MYFVKQIHSKWLSVSAPTLLQTIPEEILFKKKNDMLTFINVQCYFNLIFNYQMNLAVINNFYLLLY